MFKRTVFAVLTLMLVLGGIACGDNDKPSTNAAADSIPLLYMLRAVPAMDVSMLMYNDLTVLSEYNDVAPPASIAPREDKFAWWATFQNYLLRGYPLSAMTEVWGFDAVDVEGMLTVWVEGTPLTVLSGKLDTAAFRQKLGTYKYEEESLLGYPVYSGIPESEEELIVNLLPRACSIIERVEVKGGTVALIIMAESADNNVALARSIVEAAVTGYHEKTSLAYETGGIAELAGSLGRVGSAFITDDSRYEKQLQESDPETSERLKSAAGPGELDPYTQLAITYRKDGADSIFEFTLAYDTPSAAEANAAALRQRLSEGRSLLYDRALAEYWTVREVKADGTFLHATVKVAETTHDVFYAGMIYARDLWFLYPSR
jgi:hypothetical protein